MLMETHPTHAQDIEAKRDELSEAWDGLKDQVRSLRHCLGIAVFFLKALSHGAIFHATCNAILLLGDVKLTNTCFHHSLPKYF